MRKNLLLILLTISYTINSQVIYSEDFGTGTGAVDLQTANISAFTTLNYIASPSCDNKYRIISSNSWIPYAWHQSNMDHTPNDTDGRWFMVEPHIRDTIFHDTLVIVSINSNYKFSMFLANLCTDSFVTNTSNYAIPHVKLIISDLNGNLISQKDLKLGAYSNLNWEEFNLPFNSGQNTSLIFDIVNLTSFADCTVTGNDYLIDDITVVKDDTMSNSALNLSQTNQLSFQIFPNLLKNNSKVSMKYSLAKVPTNASIYVSSIDGKILNSINLNPKGKDGVVDLTLDRYANGIYYCTLVIDGVNAKVEKLQMIR